MVSAFQDRVSSRQATVEAACRVAMRMLATGRGQEAALQFLANVAGRLFSSNISITLWGGGESAAAEDGRRQDEKAPATPQPPGACRSFLIRSETGGEVGELHVHPSAPGCLDEDSIKSLETVAGSVGRIIARAKRTAPDDHSR